MDLKDLSDAQIRDELKRYGIIVGPCVGTTRKVYEKKLIAARAKGAPTPSAATKSPAATTSKTTTPSRTASTSRSTSNGRKSAVTVRSESEERSDTEAEPVPTPSRAKPVASTPKKKEKTIETPPAKPTPTYPIPGLNTSRNINTGLNTSIGRSTNAGHTPPRSKVVSRTPALVAKPDLNTSSYSASRSRSMLDAEPATSGDESDAHEESTRFISSPTSPSSLFSWTSAKRSTVKSPTYATVVDSGKKKSDSSFTSFFQRKPTLEFDDAPLSSYDMQVGGRHTRLSKDAKTGKFKETAYDISRILLIVLSLFLVILFIAYLTTAKKEVVVSTLKTVAGAAQDTVSFVYNYAIFPLLLVGLLAVVVASSYWIYTRRRAAQAEEDAAFYLLVDQITEKVRDAHENNGESITIPHVRDQIFPPAKRQGTELARWERAVQFVNEKESRILTEASYHRGVEVPSWKWMGSEKKQGWRGSAYASLPEVKPASCCLKVRNMYKVETGYEDEAEEVVAEVGARLSPIVPLRVEAINEKRDPCVYIKLRSKEEAAQVFTLLHSQWFNGQLLLVKYILDKRFDERFPPSSSNQS